MNRSRSTATTETYTAHYNLSRTTEGVSLKGPFKPWNPQPHNFLSESETETATKRHPSHVRSAQNVPSTHPTTASHNHIHYPSMSNSRMTSSSAATHQRVASPGLYRPDHIATVHHAYPMEPPQSQQSLSKQNTSMLNFIRSHSSENKIDNTHLRRGDDLHRAAVTSPKQFQNSSSNPNAFARVPAPPVSYSSPSSTETSPRNSADGHRPVNNTSDGEFHRHHHASWNSSTESKLNVDYTSRKSDATSSAQRMADKKAKDRQDMVAKVTEALSPTMSSRPRVPENISLGQLSLLRGDDSTAYKRTPSTEKTLESQYIRSQAYLAQPIPSQLQQRLPPQNYDPGFKNNRQQITNVMSRTPVDRSQSTPAPAPAASQSKPPPVSSSKITLPPPPAKTSSSSSRTAVNPWPFNHASAKERTSKQSSKEQPKEQSTRPGRILAASSDPDVVNPMLAHHREVPVNKAASRHTGPPVPPKHNMTSDKTSVEAINARDLPLSVSKSAVSRAAGTNGIGAGYPLSPQSYAPPPSSLVPAPQTMSFPRIKGEANSSQVQSDQCQAPGFDADLQIKSPSTTQQLSVKLSSKPDPLTALPVSTITPSQISLSTTAIEQALMTRSSPGSKSPTPPADPALSFIPVETTLVNQELSARFPIREHQPLTELEASPLFDDRDRILLVRSGGSNSRTPAILVKETVDRDSPIDTVNPRSVLTRSTAASHNHSQSTSGKTTPLELNPLNAPVHIQWIPPPEAETSSLSSVEEDDVVLPRFTNTVSHASTAAGVWTAQQKVVSRSAELSYASQAPNLYPVPQKPLHSNLPPCESDVVDSKNTGTLKSTVDVPNTKTAVTNVDRLVVGAWTTKAITNNSSTTSTALDIPKPPVKLFENAELSSKSTEAARSNGSTTGMTPGAWTSLTKYNNKPATIFDSEKTTELSLGSVETSSVPMMSSTMRHALNGSTPAGAWTTKVTQSEPPHFNSNTTPKQTSRDSSPPSATPNKHQMMPVGSGSNTPSSSQSADRHSITSPATSQNSRVPISGHPSTPAPSRPTLRQTPPPLSISSTTPDTDSLLTPSSLNSPRSTLLITQPPPPHVPVIIGPPQPPADKEKSSKSRILDFFRHSKPAPANVSYDVWVPSKEALKDKEKFCEEKKKELQPVHTQTKTTIPSVPVQSQPPPGPRSPKLFSPLKLFSKRNRTMSTASIDALDGTTTVVMNSPSSSAPDIMGTPYSPPIRDVFLATQEWRDNEANQLTRNKRPHRPGVTFDCVEDIAPIHMIPSRYKLSRSYYPEDDDD